MPVAADRNRDWEGHLQPVQELLPVFCECDSINYFRYSSWHLEKMRKLPTEHPEMYQKFMEGNFLLSRQMQGTQMQFLQT